MAIDDEFHGLSIPLLRRQLISKRAHAAKSKMQGLDRKTVMLNDISKSKIDELFEHNQNVRVNNNS